MTETRVNLLFQNEFISQESHPMLENPPYDLTLSIADLITPKERQKGKAPIPGHGKKHAKDVVDQNDHTENDQLDDNTDDDLIPRPHNAFIIFRTDYAERMKRLNHPNKVSIRVISKLASKQWETETEVVKAFFQILAEMYLHRHKIKYPHYRYAPKNRKKPTGSVKKRKSKKSTLSKAKRDELRRQRKARIITWNIHDVITEESSSAPDNPALSSAYHSMSFSNPFQNVNMHNGFGVPTPEGTYFINHSQSPSQQITPLPLVSPYHHSSQYDPNVFNDMHTLDPMSLDTLSNPSVNSPPLEEYILWTCDDNTEKDVPFGLPLITDELEHTIF